MDYTIEEKAMFMREALKEAEIALANWLCLGQGWSDYRAWT